MSVSFTYVPPVESGDRITSTHRNTMADAGNDRLRSNMGDGPWRIMFYAFSLFRQVRNPDESFNLYPAQAEFFTAYQNLDPDEYTWPVAGPGEAEGANVSSIMPAFVFGNAGANLESEDLRVADEMSGGVPLWNGLSGPPETAEEIWELGKRQRGAYDPNTGYYGAPALTAAIQHTKIAPYQVSPHGNSYGGYMPAPTYLGTCADPEFSSYEIFFTHLETGEIFGPFGTCPENSGDIYGAFQGSRFYYVYFNDGTVTTLPINEWIEGPYTGGAWVMKQSGQHIPRVLNAFAADFRGTESERETQESWLQYAFDTERFLSSQYHLAPALGNGDENGIGATYPQWSYAASSGLTKSEGDPIFKADGQETHFCHAEFVIGSVFVKAVGLNGSTAIKLFINGEEAETIAIEPDADGNFQEITTFETPETASPLAIEWGADARFRDSSGYVVIEAAEIFSYKPELHDLYLVLRLASCRTTLIDGMDGSGLNTPEANEISNSYFRYGCALNAAGDPGPAGSFAEINSNAVFDAARRLSKVVRIVGRQNFIGYEVSGGKSICYFLRRTLGGADIFDGIGPSRIQVTTGAIRADRQYIVRSGEITYRGTNYVANDVFTGVHGTSEFQGSGEVYEYNGIRATAEREGETNEWLMGHQLKVYHPSDSSIWKADAYSDYWFLSERCHFQHNGLATDLRWHFQYSPNNYIFAADAPTGWRYAKGSNTFAACGGDPACDQARVDRYKSCRIYEPEPEIESATVLIENGEEVLKLVFKTRFHHHDTAPATIDRDVSTWSIPDLNAESYRTMENGLREYLVWAHTGQNCTKGGYMDTGQLGNGAANATIWLNPDDPYGACFPHFYFVKLLPKVYEDDNDTQDSADTPLNADFWIQLEMYMRAMCEGYVDGLTSANIGCETGTNALFDYTLQSLCFEAFGGKWFNTLATAETRYLENIRDDAPQGFGQLPNTSPAAEIYNQFASAMNLLTKVRVMLPLEFEARNIHGTAQQSISDAVAVDGSPLACSAGGATAGYWSGTPPDASATSADPWVVTTGVSSLVSSGIVCDACDGGAWILHTSRIDCEWRWAFTDADAINAIPDHWQDMIADSTHLRVLAVRDRTTSTVRMRRTADVGEASECNGTPIWFDGSQYLAFEAVDSLTISNCEVVSASGRVSAPALTKAELGIGRTVTTECCMGVSHSEGITPVLGQDVAFIEIPFT